MNNLLLIQLSENEKRALIGLLIAIVLVFVIIGILGALVTKVMRWQGKKMDTLVSDVVTTRVITNKRDFFPYARKKNYRLLFKQSWLAIILILLGTSALIIYDFINHDFSYNPFNKENGFATLLFIWDFKNPEIYTKVFGLKVLCDWPKLDLVYGHPQFVKEAWASYIFVPFVIVGGVWYLIAAQSAMARTIRMFKLSKQVFEKSLDGFNQNTPFVPPVPNNVQNNINNNGL